PRLLISLSLTTLFTYIITLSSFNFENNLLHSHKHITLVLLIYHEEEVINFTQFLTLSMISIQALTKYGCNQCSTGFHAAYYCELGVDTYSSISAIEVCKMSRHGIKVEVREHGLICRLSGPCLVNWLWHIRLLNWLWHIGLLVIGLCLSR
ncbi:hypothetical protein LINPERPRIM_LOCUS20281, partial [Linum perenne]